MSADTIRAPRNVAGNTRPRLATWRDPSGANDHLATIASGDRELAVLVGAEVVYADYDQRTVHVVVVTGVGQKDDHVGRLGAQGGDLDALTLSLSHPRDVECCVGVEAGRYELFEPRLGGLDRSLHGFHHRVRLAKTVHLGVSFVGVDCLYNYSIIFMLSQFIMEVDDGQIKQ